MSNSGVNATVPRMVPPEKLAAFAIMSAAASLVPGPSMLFIMGQSIWRSVRSGAAALAGVELGYVWWFVLGALGLGTLATAFPIAFRILAIAGAMYLAWLGFTALRQAGAEEEAPARTQKPSSHAFRDGIFVAMSNPKSLIYIVALLPPFVDARAPVAPQLAVLASIGISIDVAIAAIYIVAGNGLARAMTKKGTRVWLDRGVGAIFLAIAIGILAHLLLG